MSLRNRRSKSIGIGVEERRVEDILNKLAIADPADLMRLEDIAWQRGAYVQERPLDGAEAVIVMSEARAIITVNSSTLEPTRKRFSIAHELGHWEFHRHRAHLGLCLKQDLDWQAKREGEDREQQANDFASALLIPRRFAEPICDDRDPDLEHVSELARKFAVSLTAAGRRFVALSPWACALVMVTDNRIKWFVGSNAFAESGYFVDVRAQAPTAPRNLSAGPQAIGKPRSVTADTWLAPGRYQRDLEIREQTILMPAYRSRLVMLSVDQDED